MAIPTIGAIAGYQLFSVDLNYLIKYSQMNILGVFVSFIVAYITIDFFIKFINKIGFLPFIIYRIALGLVLFLVII
jgi:undecaprenyl-diphosphatase